MLSWASNLITRREPAIISDLLIYPIKSCGKGISLESATFSQMGFEYDRQWLIVDEALSMMTARAIPKMILIQPSIDAENRTLTVSIPASDSAPASSHSIPLEAAEDDEYVTGIKVWATPTDGYIVTPLGHPLQRALSTFMGRSVLLLRKGPDIRQAGQPGFIDRVGFEVEYEDGPNTGYADGFPFLLTTEASLQDLRQRIGKATDDKTREGVKALAGAPLEQGRFRPNIVIGGTLEPWEEDGWREIRLGSERILVAARCGRCTVPEVDTETGVRQPLYPSAVLNTYRVVDRYFKGKACVGVNAIPLSAPIPVISSGDALEILARFPRDPDGGYTRTEELSD